MSTYEKILWACSEHGVQAQEILHEPALTSAVASNLANHDPRDGTKTIILTGGDETYAVTIPGPSRLDFDELRKLFGRKVKFASDKTLNEIGTEIGGVAPFGYPEQVHIFIRRDVLDRPRIYISAGRNDVTLVFARNDFRLIAVSFRAQIF